MDSRLPFRGSSDVFAWLDGFINLERGQTGRSFRLDRMELVCRAAGNPERCAPAVHVAGSKGKGSVTSMAASILDAAGIGTALYVSPHVVDYRERLGRARGPFPEDVYAAAGEELRTAVEGLLEQGGGLLPGGEEPTFFELMTALYFLCARRDGCRALAVETGMGGRLDATNVLDPRACAITPIELEHVEYLGTTIAAIAGEKAGIMKPGRPLVLAAQAPEALAVFRAAAAERGSALHYLPEVARVEDVDVDRDGTSARVSAPAVLARPLDLRLSLVGRVQASNAAQAALLVKLAFPAVDEAAIEEGLSRATLPARFERLRSEPPAVVDGAHTPTSVGLAVEAFSRLYGDGGVLLFGCAEGKDAEGMARALAGRFSSVVVTTPGTFKKSDPAAVAAAFARAGVEADLEPDTAKAIARADALARGQGKPLLATGSFYLAAAVRAAL